MPAVLSKFEKQTLKLILSDYKQLASLSREDQHNGMKLFYERFGVNFRQETRRTGESLLLIGGREISDLNPTK